MRVIIDTGSHCSTKGENEEGRAERPLSEERDLPKFVLFSMAKLQEQIGNCGKGGFQEETRDWRKQDTAESELWSQSLGTLRIQFSEQGSWSLNSKVWTWTSKGVWNKSLSMRSGKMWYMKYGFLGRTSICWFLWLKNRQKSYWSFFKKWSGSFIICFKLDFPAFTTPCHCLLMIMTYASSAHCFPLIMQSHSLCQEYLSLPVLVDAISSPFREPDELFFFPMQCSMFSTPRELADPPLYLPLLYIW